ncbi:hypothetical protein O3P69_002605 [Scylla paramamosain]|uniref:Reverse transcriptase/retrotransposon-derived protein RNase H-like domain-containing protein n=1 Tax=Scylla paramamosain TaxID=85552 RepID=A0AAW0UMJ6_SCYPA
MTLTRTFTGSSCLLKPLNGHGNTLAIVLSSHLTGVALETCLRLSDEEAVDYDKVKNALMDRFKCTEEGFRRKFQEKRPEINRELKLMEMNIIEPFTFPYQTPMIVMQTLEYVGHVIGKDVLQPQQDKVEKIRNATRPTTKKELRSLLGFNLVKKGRPNQLEWSEDQERVFSSLRRSLSYEPVLKLPILKEEFMLCTDASTKGLGRGVTPGRGRMNLIFEVVVPGSGQSWLYVGCRGCVEQGVKAVAGTTRLSTRAQARLNTWEAVCASRLPPVSITPTTGNEGKEGAARKGKEREGEGGRRYRGLGCHVDEAKWRWSSGQRMDVVNSFLVRILQGNS